MTEDMHISLKLNACGPAAVRGLRVELLLGFNRLSKRSMG